MRNNALIKWAMFIANTLRAASVKPVSGSLDIIKSKPYRLFPVPNCPSTAFLSQLSFFIICLLAIRL